MRNNALNKQTCSTLNRTSATNNEQASAERLADKTQFGGVSKIRDSEHAFLINLIMYKCMLRTPSDDRRIESSTNK